MVTKGEIARFEQFLLLSPCFQKAAADDFENIPEKYKEKKVQ